MPINEGGLGIIDIETQCRAIKCAILSKFLKDTHQNKSWAEMLWHLDKFRNAKQGINVFKTHIPRLNKGNKQDRFTTDLLTAWVNLTNNDGSGPAHAAGDLQ